VLTPELGDVYGEFTPGGRDQIRRIIDANRYAMIQCPKPYTSHVIKKTMARYTQKIEAMVMC
jgi:hypothetical protein